MRAQVILALSFGIPASGALFIGLTDRWPNLREAITLLTASALFAVNVWLLIHSLDGGVVHLQMMSLAQHLPISFSTEPLGLIFATLASGLWVVISVFSIGYMRGTGARHQTRFYICFAVALAATMGVAYASNLLTLFLFYELLTLATYPLVAHDETESAKSGARIYISILLGTSLLFFLTAIAWTWSLTGTLDFAKGGILSGKIEGPPAALLFALFMFGVGKAALMPFHRWLPAAMAAPAPVSALLHAVAVVKAGAFTVLKVAVYIFGIDFLASPDITGWLMWVAAFTLIVAALIALRQDNLKARLAYSTVSQLAYITLGVSLATKMGIIGGAIQMLAHALAKITLFMCAGAIFVASGKENVSEMRGLGRVMPFTFIAFLLGSLSIIGLPPTGGSWSKWFLMIGAVDAGQKLLISVWMLSSLLGIAYLIPVVARGFFLPLSGQADRPQPQGAEISVIRWAGMREAPLLCVVPACVTGALSVLIYFAALEIVSYISPILEP